MIGIGIGTHRRRYQDFAPDDLADLAIWLRADQGITTVGGAVEFWNFINGTFRGVFRSAQGAGANRPTHVLSDPNYNNRPVLSFDGDDWLDTPAFTAPITQPITVFIVCESSGDAQTFMDSTFGDRIIVDIRNNNNRIHAGVNLEGSVATTNPRIIEALFDGISSELIINGTSDASGDAGVLPLPDLRIGANITPGNYLVGIVAEYIMYNVLLNAGDRTLVRNYLNMRYAIY